MDILVANAASWEVADTPLHTMALRHWQSTIDGVLTSTFLSVREFLRMVAKERHAVTSCVDLEVRLVLQSDAEVAGKAAAARTASSALSCASLTRA